MKENNHGLREYLHIDYCIVAACLTMLVVLTIFGVFRRYVMNNPVSWMEEMQMIFIIWSVFFGGSIAFRRKGHIAIEIVVDSMPENWKKIIRIGISIVVVLVLVFMIKQGFSFLAILAKIGRRTSVLHIPSQYVYAAIPLGCIMMLIEFIHSEWKDYRGEESK